MTKTTHKSEDRIQQECVMKFHNKYPELRGLLFAVPNGGARSAREGKLFKMTGVVRGVSDMLFIFNRNVFCFELKNKFGKQSEYQIAWQRKVTRQGVLYFLIRDSEYFMEIINEIITEYS